MIVIVRMEVDDVTRRAIRRSKGEPGLATRAEIASLVETCFDTSIVDIVNDELALTNPREAGRE